MQLEGTKCAHTNTKSKTQQEEAAAVVVIETKRVFEAQPPRRRLAQEVTVGLIAA